MESTPKILFISIFKEGDGGGEGRVAYEMARWYSHHYPVVMLSPGANTGLSIDATGFKRFQVQSIRRGNLALPLLSTLNVRKVYQFLDEYHPDIIHIHDPALLGVVGQLWAKLNHVPVVYTAHVLPSRALDFGASEMTNFLSSPINESIAERYLLNFYENCDAVVALNQNAAEEVRAFGYTGQVEIIPNGRNLSQYHACQFADPTSTDKHLAFIGFLNKRKNQAYLLEVMQHLPQNYHLTLIGEPLQPSFLDELKQTVAEHHLHVSFTGQISQQEIAAILEKTHVFVSASKMEVQSLVIIEALASGTPVVGLSNETVDELVDNSNGQRLEKDASPQEFARVVQRICSLSASEYTALCKNARVRVQNLDWSNIMTRAISAYKAILARRPITKQGINDKMLRKYISRIQDEGLQDDILEIVSYLTPANRPIPDVNLKAVWMAWLNMTASTVGYYVLKNPATIKLKQNVEKHRLIMDPIIQVLKSPPRHRSK